MPGPVAIASLRRSASSTGSDQRDETTYLESSWRTLLGSESGRGRASECRSRNRHLQLEPPKRARRCFAAVLPLVQQPFHPLGDERTRVGRSATRSGVRAAQGEVLEVGVVRVQGDEKALREDGGRGADRQGTEGGQVREGKAEFALQIVNSSSVLQVRSRERG